MDEENACPKCGGNIIAIFETSGVLGECESCDYLIEGVFDPPLPEWAPCFQDAFIVLESVGPSPLEVASLIRAAKGLTVREALALIRTDKPTIARLSEFKFHILEEIQSKLTALGATSTLHRIP